MKNSFWGILCFVFILTSCETRHQGISEEELKRVMPSEYLSNKTSIEFENSEHDFGDVQQGEQVKTTFRFKNSGNNDLLIVSAVGSCGCTVPSFPKEPIAPGEDGEINVQFNTAGKKGKQSKSITITANTEPNQTRIKIIANILSTDSTKTQP